jgi:hypothetical protein
VSSMPDMTAYSLSKAGSYWSARLLLFGNSFVFEFYRSTGDPLLK